MKWILIISSIFAFSANANNKVNFTLEHTPEIIENLLVPVWKEVPYIHTWKNKSNKTSDKTLSASIVNANIKLGKKGTPLVDIAPVAKDLVDLNWKLNQLQIDGLVRIRFQYKKFGIKLSHTEDFNMKGHTIKNAKSRVSLFYDQDKLKLNIDYNKGFNFERVTVSPRNGMGKTLRWIFDNVFSKDEVDRFVTQRANNELRKWANSKEMIQDIETAVNNELDKFQKNKVSLGDLSTNIVVKVDDFSMDEAAINVKADVSFDNQDRKIHMCANELMQDLARKQRKNIVESATVSVTHPLIEQGLINYSAYEMFDANNKLLEPLFCVGYKEFDQKGNPFGEEEVIDIGIRKLNFKYWVKPATAPEFIYHVDNNEILVGMKFALSLESKRMPMARVSNGPLIAGVLVGFSPKHDPVKGLVLQFNGLEITEISGGNLQVKWALLLPYVTINVAKYEQRIEKLLNKEINKSLDNGQLVVIDQAVDVTDNLSLELRGHELTTDTHKVQFDLLTK
jgi:hypothetical protein